MSRILPSDEITDIRKIFLDQIDQIRSRRSIRIKLVNFPASALFATICETLHQVLEHHGILLERLVLADNALQSLPTSISPLLGNSLKVLDLHNNAFTTVPSVVIDHCPYLERLDLSQNSISLISNAQLECFANLRQLLLKENHLTTLPSILGELPLLEALSVSGNPLLAPPVEFINSLSGGIAELKSFLVANKSLLDQSIEAQSHSHQTTSNPITPNVARTKSLSDTRSRSSKASRRMGLIINNGKSNLEPAPQSTDSFTPSKPDRMASSVFHDQKDRSVADSNTDAYHLLNSNSNHALGGADSTSPPASVTSSNPSRSTNQHRKRSNTLKDLGGMLELSDLTENDQNSGAYFRRLSVLQEQTVKESFHIASDEHSSEGSKSSILQDISPIKHQSRKTPQPNHNAFTSMTALSSHTQASAMQASKLATSLEKDVLERVSRKILFALSEFHLSIKRFTGFCTDRKVSAKIAGFLQISKERISNLVETMEAVEETEDGLEAITTALLSCIASFKSILATLSENLMSFTGKIDVCFIRMVILTLFGSLNELQNAQKLLSSGTGVSKAHPSMFRSQTLTMSTATDTKPRLGTVHFEDVSAEAQSFSTSSEAVTTIEEIDERLYQSIDVATMNAQIIFSELTKTINKSALATANKGTQSIGSHVALKFKDLTTVCVTSMEVTRRLTTKLASIRANQNLQAKKSFWDDINLFLKAIIQTFSAVKDIMKDAPIFNEVRRSMANLTKTTKDLTILLEASSYKSMSELQVSPPTHNMLLPNTGLKMGSQTQNYSLSNLQMLSGGLSGVHTPLVATVGAAAAHAILAQQDHHQSAVSNTLQLPLLNIPPLVASDLSNTGLHTAPVQSMEQYYAKNVNPFDRVE